MSSSYQQAADEVAAAAKKFRAAVAAHESGGGYQDADDKAMAAASLGAASLHEAAQLWVVTRLLDQKDAAPQTAPQPGYVPPGFVPLFSWRNSWGGPAARPASDLPFPPFAAPPKPAPDWEAARKVRIRELLAEVLAQVEHEQLPKAVVINEVRYFVVPGDTVDAVLERQAKAAYTQPACPDFGGFRP